MTTVGESASDSIDRDLASLTASAIDAQAERWPGLYDAFTIKQLERAVEDTRFHLQFLSAALWSGEQVVMDDHYCWTRDLFANIGLKQEWLDGALDDIRAVLVGALPTDEGREAARMIDHAMAGDHCSAVPALSLIHI